MAVRIEGPVSWPAPGSIAKYPWADWLDGSRWTVTLDDMLRGSLESFRNYLYKIGRREGLTIKSRFVGCDPLTGDPLAVEFQVVSGE
jgi:hypothetical protein